MTRYTIRRPDLWQPAQCDCGVAVLARSMALHRRSIAHKDAKRIRALLDTPCITLEDIAERVGLTRQRVHQIAQRLGIECGSRRAVCVIRRAFVANETRNETRLKTDRVLVAVNAVCRQRGLNWEPTTSRVHGHDVVNLSHVIINGQRCRLRVATIRPSGYVALHGSIECTDDFVLYLLSNGQWIVFPRKNAPSYNVTFALAIHGTRGITHQRRHDWRDYIDAWHLLAKQESIAA